MPAETLLWAPQAWVDGAWRDRVLLAIGADGHWSHITCDVPAPAQATQLDGPALPGLVNAHSHAFQRAFVGLAERSEGGHDDFWAWRDRMYGVALRITAPQLRAVAAHLYAELLAGGYTHVCEFHYLQHAPDGSAYPVPETLALALADAAAEVGIGLTVLPVLYERAGFGESTLRHDQRRFKAGPGDVLALRDAVRSARRPLVDAGVAIHSLRAARPESLQAVADGAGDGPIHIHVAEQVAEVEECILTTGSRPVQWLAQHVPALDSRWQLVHATHVLPAEIVAVAKSGAGVVLCPGTEANLGDGVVDLPAWLDAGVPLSIGSDSQVTRCWTEELRWLEYTQRLVRRQRNVSAAPGLNGGREGATAARLFERVRQSGAAAAGRRAWGLQRGARADLLVVDTEDSALRGLPPTHWLDGLVFAAPRRPFSRVMVAGHWTAPDREAIAARFERAMQALWQT
jgi:formimidoylglutamate deiminase